jgi:hypothetical protein
MDPLVQVAAISVITALIVGVFGLLQTKIVGSQATSRQRDDWARQDKVAREVREVARLTSLSANDTKVQLRKIHTLVNSDMTASRQETLDQTRVTLMVLRRLVASSGDPNIDDIAAIDSAERRIKELEGILADRLFQLRESEGNQL